MLINENQLDSWVRGNQREAQEVIVELILRLVSASCPNPKFCRFPLGSSIGQHGSDGVLEVEKGYAPYVPSGHSIWEIGTGTKPGKKATSDYNDSTRDVPKETRGDSAFIFVTPLSGVSGWEYTWKTNQQATWLKTRRKKNEWKDVRTIDGTIICDWLSKFPAVAKWMLKKMHQASTLQIDTPELHWKVIRTIGEPPPLTPQIFLCNRDSAYVKVKEVFAGVTSDLVLDTRFPDQVVDFVSACIESMDENDRYEAYGRCVFVSSVEAWNTITDISGKRFVLVADSRLDLSDNEGLKLIQKAHLAGHAVIYGSMPGGIPHPNRTPISNPKPHQIKDALKASGYTEERARIISEQSNGDLGSLLRCLQNLSRSPQWALQGTTSELAIANLLGSWSDKSEVDRKIVEQIGGNSYGEWIGKMRKVALQPSTPLNQQDGIWKFIARYEGWHTLGNRLYDEHLEKFLESAEVVLKEKDPKFELAPDRRYMSPLYGKVPTYSKSLKKGLAESLAIMGSLPNVLQSCSIGKAETIAALAVRRILLKADWILWASLNNLLPLLAEASPEEFLFAVEDALNSTPCPFDELFAQEGEGLMGTTYLSGLLWALETLAWSPEYLNRTTICLGELDSRDPGGNWTNRPSNSLRDIFLPWLPQTCASVEKRITAIQTLIKELPEAGWKLLLKLLPQVQDSTSYTRKPVWREIIPTTWSEKVTNKEYNEQISKYAEMATATAKNDLKKLAELIERLENLPTTAQDKIIEHLNSDFVTKLPETDRLAVWNELMSLIAKHTRFKSAQWALPSNQVEKIALVTSQLTPVNPLLRYQRIFSDRNIDLFDEDGDYRDQVSQLDLKRKKAIEEIFLSGGVQAVIDFTSTVQSPWQVGKALGEQANPEIDIQILPNFLLTKNTSLFQFVGSFIQSRFAQESWDWADNILKKGWDAEQIGQFLAFLPFVPKSWEGVEKYLGEEQESYWKKTNGIPHQIDSSLEYAINKLLQYGRFRAAIVCLFKLVHEKKDLNPEQAVKALRAAVKSKEKFQSHDAYEIAEIIKSLQSDSRLETYRDELAIIEWSYINLLDGTWGASPKILERHLSEDPSFFCKIVQLIYRPHNDNDADSPVKEAEEHDENVARNAYHLLKRWRVLPGYQQGGSLNSNALRSWVDEVMKISEESGHSKICTSIIGELFAHAPNDPDGLWIHRSILEIMNAKNASIMRDGFRSELFNSRGVYSYSSGDQEKKLAQEYKNKADVIEEAGFHRVAATLRDLAKAYEDMSIRESSRDPFEE